MNTYLIPMNEGTGPYIKKIVANSEQTAKEKLYKQLYDKYDFVEGNTRTAFRRGDRHWTNLRY